MSLDQAPAARGRVSLAAALPDFPWDSLTGAKAKAAAHPDGIVDLSIGTPVDSTPQLGIDALIEAANSPGYPVTSGTLALRQAMSGYLNRRWRAELEPEATLPVIGTKELVGWLPQLLGLGAGDVVVIPSTAYPTYAVGAQIAGCEIVVADDLTSLGDLAPALVWINSPSNPTGEILSKEELTARVAWARERGAILASDECYAEFSWEAESFSVLDPAISGDSNDGLLAVHSLSKRSNLAGYRAGFIAGDQALITELLSIRKHAGMIVPGPVQHAMVALLNDQDHVELQRERYLNRRSILRPALESAGFRIEHSEGSLYLWSTRDEDCRDSVDFLAGYGILAAPGDFYGEAARQFVRVALTATDERIEAAAARLLA